MVGNQDAVRRRFARTAAMLAALEERQRDGLAAKVRELIATRGDELALDVGAGSGALAFALAPLVREVVAVELVPECIEEGRARGAAYPNVVFREGDATKLDFPAASFDLAGCLRTLHHVAGAELVVAEIARVTRPSGRILVIDQIAPADPAEARVLDRFERARDPSHSRCLSDRELRALFAANGLILAASRLDEETRELETYLDRAGCHGVARQRAAALAPAPVLSLTMAWYVLTKPAT